MSEAIMLGNGDAWQVAIRRSRAFELGIPGRFMIDSSHLVAGLSSLAMQIFEAEVFRFAFRSGC